MKEIAYIAIETLPVLVVMALGALALGRACNRVISHCNAALRRVEAASLIGGKRV
jgi:hypothetical protein